MLKENETYLDYVEQQYPGIRKQIESYERAELPACYHCGSTDTAQVIAGLMGRTICLAGATSKVKLVPNRDKNGRYYCHECGQFSKRSS